jgi:hypothetical protein
VNDVMACALTFGLVRASKIGFRAYIPLSMRCVQILAAMLLLVSFSACETTNVAGRGTQEAKHLAALERLRQQPPLPEDRANLWNAHEDILDRDSNPLRAY